MKWLLALLLFILPVAYGQIPTNAPLTQAQSVTFAAAAGMGSGAAAPVCDTADGVQCTNLQGTVTLTTAATGTSAGDIFSISWPSNPGKRLSCVFGFASGPWAAGYLIYDMGNSSNTLAMMYSNATPTGATTYKISYVCQ